MTEREVLVRARERVARGWCQRALRLPLDGSERVCLLGAFVVEDGGWVNNAVWGTAGGSAAKRRLDRFLGWSWADWNNAPERTQRDVLDLLDAAIAEVDFEAESAPEPAVERVAA